MGDNKNIDGLAVRHSEKTSELLVIKEEILNSSTPAAVVFIDLADSTALKHKGDDETWLTSIYEFIRVVADLVHEIGGTLVKRLGDGVLITFANVAAAELFVDAARQTARLQKYAYKLAADFGSVYYFKFEDNLKDDPYGAVVDRCSRLSAVSRPGLPLFSETFVKASSKSGDYHFALMHRLKGFPIPERIFAQSPASAQAAQTYLAPLLDTLNDEKIGRLGYRYHARTFSVQDFSALTYEARPFLLRELFNLPKLPFSFAQFSEHAKRVPNDEDLYDFFGMLVEWECRFGSYSRRLREDILVHAHGEAHFMLDIHLKLPASMFDIVRLFKRDDRIRFRGVIQDLNTSWVDLNYVDFELASDPPVHGAGGG